MKGTAGFVVAAFLFGLIAGFVLCAGAQAERYALVSDEQKNGVRVALYQNQPHIMKRVDWDQGAK